MKILKKNNINLKLSTDLHGMNISEALINTATTILKCYKNHIKYALIIHGKGEGVLRSKIKEFLKLNKLVSNFSVAPQKMGGHGAILVQIKKTNKKII